MGRISKCLCGGVKMSKKGGMLLKSVKGAINGQTTGVYANKGSPIVGFFG